MSCVMFGVTLVNNTLAIQMDCIATNKLLLLILFVIRPPYVINNFFYAACGYV